MPPTFVLARDHLERAAAILQGPDSQSRQLRHIIERTIGLMEELETELPPEAGNILDFSAFRRGRHA
ncbi:hypothetical protein [uncultured Devosia sp.]|uniref:hypothetical protein n=1 Tax=uncultured Devosia sp. TaxID=211434 RepID=UPI0035CB917D